MSAIPDSMAYRLLLNATVSHLVNDEGGVDRLTEDPKAYFGDFIKKKESYRRLWAKIPKEHQDLLIESVGRGIKLPTTDTQFDKSIPVLQAQSCGGCHNGGNGGTSLVTVMANVNMAVNVMAAVNVVAVANAGALAVAIAGTATPVGGQGGGGQGWDNHDELRRSLKRLLASYH